jgi:hypothetical protein
MAAIIPRLQRPSVISYAAGAPTTPRANGIDTPTGTPPCKLR